MPGHRSKSFSIPPHFLDVQFNPLNSQSSITRYRFKILYSISYPNTSNRTPPIPMAAAPTIVYAYSNTEFQRADLEATIKKLGITCVTWPNAKLKDPNAEVIVIFKTQATGDALKATIEQYAKHVSTLIHTTFLSRQFKHNPAGAGAPAGGPAPGAGGPAPGAGGPAPAPLPILGKSIPVDNELVLFDDSTKESRESYRITSTVYSDFPIEASRIQPTADETKVDTTKKTIVVANDVATAHAIATRLNIQDFQVVETGDWDEKVKMLQCQFKVSSAKARTQVIPTTSNTASASTPVMQIATRYSSQIDNNEKTANMYEKNHIEPIIGTISKILLNNPGLIAAIQGSVQQVALINPAHAPEDKLKEKRGGQSSLWEVLMNLLNDPQSHKILIRCRKYIHEKKEYLVLTCSQDAVDIYQFLLPIAIFVIELSSVRSPAALAQVAERVTKYTNLFKENDQVRRRDDSEANGQGCRCQLYWGRRNGIPTQEGKNSRWSQPPTATYQPFDDLQQCASSNPEMDSNSARSGVPSPQND